MTEPDGHNGKASNAVATERYWNITRLKRRKNGSCLFIEDAENRLLGYVKIIHSQKTRKLYLNAYTLEDIPLGSFATYEKAFRALSVASETHQSAPKSPDQTEP